MPDRSSSEAGRPGGASASGPSGPEIFEALAHLPAGLFLMTAAFEEKRAGLMVRSVQQCADEPVLIAVSARRGLSIAPLIRDSRGFAISMLTPTDRLALRKFAVCEAESEPPDAADDPFESFEVMTIATGAPVLAQAVVGLDCEVVRHFDLEADHEIYIGQVLGGWVRPARDEAG